MTSLTGTIREINEGSTRAMVKILTVEEKGSGNGGWCWCSKDSLGRSTMAGKPPKSLSYPVKCLHGEKLPVGAERKYNQCMLRR